MKELLRIERKLQRKRKEIEELNTFLLGIQFYLADDMKEFLEKSTLPDDEKEKIRKKIEEYLKDKDVGKLVKHLKEEVSQKQKEREILERRALPLWMLKGWSV